MLNKKNLKVLFAWGILSVMDREKIIIFAYGFIINLSAFIVYRLDKQRAIHHQQRVPEKTLLGLMWLGGALGGLLGMLLAHHKTKKIRFWLHGVFSFFVYAILLYVALTYL